MWNSTVCVCMSDWDRMCICQTCMKCPYCATCSSRNVFCLGTSNTIVAVHSICTCKPHAVLAGTMWKSTVRVHSVWNGLFHVLIQVYTQMLHIHVQSIPHSCMYMYIGHTLRVVLSVLWPQKSKWRIWVSQSIQRFRCRWRGDWKEALAGACHGLNNQLCSCNVLLALGL